MKRKILSLLLLSFIIIKAYPQNVVSKEIRGERGISKQFISLDDEQLVNFNAGQVKSLLGLNQNSELVLNKTEQDRLGFTHYRYYQTYRSIPIENSMYRVHTKNGALKSLGGAIVTDFDPAMDSVCLHPYPRNRLFPLQLKQWGLKSMPGRNQGWKRF
jgi:Zn-dependent metalloprotease